MISKVLSSRIIGKFKKDTHIYIYVEPISLNSKAQSRKYQTQIKTSTIEIKSDKMYLFPPSDEGNREHKKNKLYLSPFLMKETWNTKNKLYLSLLLIKETGNIKNKLYLSPLLMKETGNSK